MPDREKVIVGLEECLELLNCIGTQSECKQYVSDALALMKEQQVEIEQLTRFMNGFSRSAVVPVRCKDCKQGGIDSTSYPQYWCSSHSEYHDGDWFCADGECKEGR